MPNWVLTHISNKPEKFFKRLYKIKPLQLLCSEIIPNLDIPEEDKEMLLKHRKHINKVRLLVHILLIFDIYYSDNKLKNYNKLKAAQWLHLKYFHKYKEYHRKRWNTRDPKEFTKHEGTDKEFKLRGFKRVQSYPNSPKYYIHSIDYKNKRMYPKYYDTFPEVEKKFLAVGIDSHTRIHQPKH